MKALLSAVVFLFLFNSLNIAQSVVGLGNTDPSIFTRYKLPLTEYRRFSLDGNARFSSNRTENSNFGSTLNSSGREFSFSLSPEYLYSKVTDDQSFGFTGYLSAGINNNKSEDLTNNNSSSFDFKNLNLGLQADRKDYFSAGTDLFYNTGLNANVSMFENKNENTNAGVTRTNWQNNKTQNYSASFGIGYGRLRDVTPVVMAVRFQERLKVLGKINGDLPDEAILNIGQQFSRYGYYNNVYSRPDKYFWDDMDKVLAKDNVRLNDLNLYSVSYLQEVFSELRFQRLEGHYFGFRLALNYNNYYNSIENQPQPRQSSIQESLFLKPELFASYSHQLDLYSQFRVDLNVSGGPDIIKNSLTRQQYDLILLPAYSRELTDRFVFYAENRSGYRITNAATSENRLTNDLLMTFTYFVENNLNLYLNYSWRFTEIHDTLEGFIPFPSDRESRINSIHTLSLGFTYYFQNSLIH